MVIKGYGRRPEIQKFLVSRRKHTVRYRLKLPDVLASGIATCQAGFTQKGIRFGVKATSNVEASQEKTIRETRNPANSACDVEFRPPLPIETDFFGPEPLHLYFLPFCQPGVLEFLNFLRFRRAFPVADFQRHRNVEILAFP